MILMLALMVTVYTMVMPIGMVMAVTMKDENDDAIDDDGQ